MLLKLAETLTDMEAAMLQDGAKQKAEILLNFADEVSQGILRRAGFPDTGPRKHNINLICFVGDDLLPEDAPKQYFEVLCLRNVSSALDEEGPYERGESNGPDNIHTLLLGPDHVAEWNWKTSRVSRTMSYEDAARLVIFFLMEKMLQIMRKQRWDKISTMPNLFDQLAKLAA